MEPVVYQDDRGFFFESFNARDFNKVVDQQLIFVQDNASHSRKGVLRGLHYQISMAQGKLVRVVRGRIWDVAVDLRRSSPTFGKWTGAELSEDNRRQIWIPPGLAHGFLVLSNTADVVYKATEFYAPQFERTLAWDDPDVGIDWPKIDVPPILSDKDTEGSAFADCELFQ